MPYTEIGANFLANFGFGATVAIERQETPSLLGHLFFGIPIPLTTAPPRFFIEPYYRPA